MDILGLVDLPRWLVGIAMLVLSVCVYTLYKQTFFKRNGFVQKSTLFFLGDIPELAKKGIGHIDVTLVRKYGKVFGRYIGNQPSLVISDPEIIKTVFVKEFSNFTERDYFPTSNRWKNGVAGAKGSHWKFLRRTISPTFSSGKMRQMTVHLKQCLNKFHSIVNEKVDQRNDFDFTPDSDNLFLKYARHALEFSGPSSVSFLANTLFPDCSLLHKIIGPVNILTQKTWDFFRGATSTAFEDRKESSSTHMDLLQLMINAHKDTHMDKEETSDKNDLTAEDFKRRGLTDDEVLMNSLLFILAGYDTTETTLSWLVYEMMVHPQVQNKLREEIDTDIGQDEPTYDSVFKMSYLDMVVSETLRLHPPVVNLMRVANNDTEVCGMKIPKNMIVFCFPSVLHVMEEYWENPYEYIPERFAPENKDNINEYAYMPFGLGPRNCMGTRLALLEVKMTLVSILQKYIIHKSDKLKVPMPFVEIGLRKPKEPVYVHLEKRNI